MKAIDKVKNHIKEHKVEIAVGAYGMACVAVGYVIGTKIDQYLIATGLEKIHKAGFIKFFDPGKAVEVNIEEVCKLIGEAKL